MKAVLLITTIILVIGGTQSMHRKIIRAFTTDSPPSKGIVCLNAFCNDSEAFGLIEAISNKEASCVTNHDIYHLKSYFMPTATPRGNHCLEVKTYERALAAEGKQNHNLALALGALI